MYGNNNSSFIHAFTYQFSKRSLGWNLFVLLFSQGIIPQAYYFHKDDNDNKELDEVKTYIGGTVDRMGGILINEHTGKLTFNKSIKCG